jgi:hypothetical protein
MRYRPEGFGVVDPTTRKGATFGRDPESLRSAWIAKAARIVDAETGQPIGAEMAAELFAKQFGGK